MADQVKIRTPHGDSVVDVPKEGSFQRTHWDRLQADGKLEVLGTVDVDGKFTPAKARKAPAKKAAAAKKAPAKKAAAKPQGAVVADSTSE